MNKAVSKDGTTIAYDQTGSGPPLVESTTFETGVLNLIYRPA